MIAQSRKLFSLYVSLSPIKKDKRKRGNYKPSHLWFLEWLHGRRDREKSCDGCSWLEHEHWSTIICLLAKLGSVIIYLGQVWSRLHVSDRSGLHCQEWGGKEVHWIKFGVLYRGWECLRIRGLGEISEISARDYLRHQKTTIARSC